MTKRSRTRAKKVFNILSIFLAISLIIPVYSLPVLSVSAEEGQIQETQKQESTQEFQGGTDEDEQNLENEDQPQKETENDGGESHEEESKENKETGDKEEDNQDKEEYEPEPKEESIKKEGKDQTRTENKSKESEDHKIIICHNGQTIEIDASAFGAHEEHGDYEGECQNTGDDETDEENEEEDNNEEAPVCGNAIVEEGEMCDDGNIANGDGCSNTCQFETLSCENVEGNGWYAEYFNYSGEHADMQLNPVSWPDDGHGDPLSQEGPWDTNWYNNEYFKFSRIDSNLKFGEDFFPFDVAQEETNKGGSDNEQHEFHFGVHWRALVTGEGVYEYRLKSDDDAWVYVDGKLLASLPGVHAPEVLEATTTLSGAHVVDIYFTERHTTRSHFSFEFRNGENPITITPLPEQCQPSVTVCKYIDETGDGASEDDEKYGEGWKFALVDADDQELPLVEDMYKETDGSSCVSYENLLPGTYRSIEEQLPNWPLTAAQVVKNNNTPEDVDPFPYSFVDVDAELNDDITINYYNYGIQYCGDGVVNQAWETCDGGDQCTDQCQLADDTMCRDLVLAQVNVDNVINEEAGSTTNEIYLGSALNKIPEGTWFALFNEGSFITDPSVSSYEDVDGLAVERQEGKLRVVMHGSKGKNDIEHTQGTVAFSNANITDVASDNANALGKSNRLENGFDGTGIGDVNPGNDEVATSSTDTVDYYLTTNVADDGFITSWEIVEDCIGICGFKFNDENENEEVDEEETGLSGWEFNLQEKLQCEVGEDWADQVVSFTQGNQSDDSPVPAERSDASKALGQAQGDDTNNFVSLGIGGELVLYFENLIENGPGDDIEVVETSFNSPSCGDYPEHVEVYASQTGLDGSWESLGIAKCLDATFDLGSLPWAQYVKLVDKTNPDLFDGVVDGYDIDGVRALHCKGLSEVLATETSNQNGEFCFVDELEAGNYHISETMQNGWKNTTPIAQQVEFNGEGTIYVEFGNTKLPEPPAQCEDGIDNDGDNLIDEADPDCHTDGDPENGDSYDPDRDEINNNNGGGGGTSLVITNETTGTTTATTAIVTWDTNLVATSRVVFSTSSTSTLGVAPNYGYGNSTAEHATTTTNHSVELTDLSPDTTYYWRAVSHEEGATTTEVLGIELSFTTRTLPQCSDGEDNDGDNLSDTADPSCHTDGDPENSDSYDPDADEDEVDLVITNEQTSNIGETNATLTWDTNIPATTRAVFGTTGTSTLGVAPNYGYATSTEEVSATTTSHSATLTGLSIDTTYFWRAVSKENATATIEIIGDEISFTTNEEDDDNGGGGQGGTETGTSGGGGGGGTITGTDPFSYGTGGGGGTYVPTDTFTPTPPVGGETSTSEEPSFGQGGGEIIVAQGPGTSAPGTGEAPGTTTEEEPTTEEPTDEITDQVAGLAFLGVNYDCEWWVSLLALIVLAVTTFYVYKKRESVLQAIIVFVVGLVIFFLLGAYNCLWLLALLALVVILLIGVLLRSNNDTNTPPQQQQQKFEDTSKK